MSFLNKIIVQYAFNKALGRQTNIRVLRLSSERPSFNFSHKEEELNGLQEKEYLKYCTSFMRELGDVLEESGSQRINDVEIKDGVIKVVVTGNKTFIINRQVPNKQIWYSSPISGPQRFNYFKEEQAWKNQKDEELSKLLFKEIDQI